MTVNAIVMWSLLLQLVELLVTLEVVMVSEQDDRHILPARARLYLLGQGHPLSIIPAAGVQGLVRHPHGLGEVHL